MSDDLRTCNTGKHSDKYRGNSYQVVFPALYLAQQEGTALSGNTLANQHRDIMETCSFHPDAGLHALRHTFLTEAGRQTKNVRALQKLPGHSQIQTTMRYIQSDQDDISAIAGAVQSSREKRNKKPSGVTTVFTTVGKQENRQARKM